VKAELDQIGDEGLDLVSTLSVDWLRETLGSEANYSSDTAGRLSAHLSRSDDTVTVDGQVELQLTANCSRCLTAMAVPVRTHIQVSLVPRDGLPAAAANGELSEDDVGLSTYEGRTVDLGRIVHDEVLLDLPMQVLCSEDCRGLCATCGKNRNVEPCSCANTLGEGRLAQLAHIKLA
jgi:uncharacterized protein